MNLQRFVDAQERDYSSAMSEISRGRKTSHWIWYIFPQITGLGFSEMSKRYAIGSLEEAMAYLQHPILGKRLVNICAELLKQKGTAREIMGSPDDLKLRSSMTLFALIPGVNPIFNQVLTKFYDGQKDPATLASL